MSDKMYPVSLKSLLNWILNEFAGSNSVFGIPENKFYRHKETGQLKIFGEMLETPLGPAAGPHTQLAQNIVSAYLTGGRFFELKTVQILDKLKIDKPCIEASDEGYNVEWSQELTLDESYAEYLKAWFLLHFIRDIFRLSGNRRRGFVFNMSVGYDLEGISSPRMDQFIEHLKDARKSELFEQLKSELSSEPDNGSLFTRLKNVSGMSGSRLEEIRNEWSGISARIANSVTLSTMHGCPSDEIESIARYLISEKGLHTYVKLNPTLLGFEAVQTILNQLGYRYIQLDKTAFEKDLQFTDAIPMLKRLSGFARQHSVEFGVKLSNTLGVKNTLQSLPGEEMYMSGRSLFPLTIRLAHKISGEFEGKLRISFSGGAANNNIREILQTGIYPVTLVTDILKPGGYARFRQMLESVNSAKITIPAAKINLARLKKLAETSGRDHEYRKSRRGIDTIKIEQSLPQFDCYVAPCQVACPIHQDIPEYVRLLNQGRYEEAFRVIVGKNPLPHITGYICDHQCMFHCTRWDYDAPVLIRDIKREAAETAFEDYLKKWKKQFSVKSPGIRAAVIGAGPAGLSAAYFLAKNGFEVTVFDKNRRAGGTVQNVIPPFRLPQQAIDHDIEFIRSYGVNFEFGWDGNQPVSDLQNKEGFKYLFIGIGAGQAVEAPFRSENGKILNAVEFLWDFHRNKDIELGKSVAVVGGGNSAMDSARAALRCNAVEQVSVIYRRTSEFMPADREEFEAAMQDGIQFRELLLPREFENGRLTCQKMQLAEPGPDGRRSVKPIEEEFESIQADSVISAIGEKVDSEFLKKNGIEFDRGGKIKVNPETNETSVPNVFIGGDALSGPATVVEAIAGGKQAAETIILRETGSLPEQPDFSTLFNKKDRLLDILERKAKVQAPVNEDLREESARCLECNIVCNKCVEVCPNRANVAVRISGSSFKDEYQILHLDALCNECGNCETFCPYTGAPFKEKTTLFRSEKDFLESSNSGFFRASSDSAREQTFRYRFGAEAGELHFDSSGRIFNLEKRISENSEFKKFTSLLEGIVRENSYLLEI